MKMKGKPSHHWRIALAMPLILLTISILLTTVSVSDAAAGEPTARRLYGNVYGRITDRNTDAPTVGAEVILSTSTAAEIKTALAASKPVTAVKKTLSGPDGRFLISGVPIHGNTQKYTLLITHAQKDPVLISQMPVLPGALMSLNVTCRMSEEGLIQSFTGTARNETVVIRYRHILETRKRPLIPPPPVRSQTVEEPLALNLYATREGLVGHTTANGHVIKKRDRFVALPSTSVLCTLGGNEFQVELQFNGRSVIAPVWDIGPWNIHDNYWDPEQKRQIYGNLKHGGETGGLGQGIPEAQAAFQSDFNSGKDEFSRLVSNPAGIDLADGTFWDDLGLTDNDWITVRFLWINSGKTPPPQPDNERSSKDIGCFLNTIIP